MKQIKEFNQILDITSEVLNVPKLLLTSKNRSMHLAIPRAIACVVGMKDALIKKEIVAKCINRHRTATYHYLYKHDEFFKYHAPYRAGYMKVLKEYKRIDKDKKIFLDKNQFNIFIKNLNINDSKNPDIMITIKSSKYRHVFYSDCFNFTEHMKKIHKCFDGYKYNVNYKSYEG